MDELVVTQVDAGVTDATTTTVGGEEQQVTRFKFVASNQRGLHVDHIASGARQIHASLFAKQIPNETAAIEAGFGGTAKKIAGPDQGHASLQDAVSQPWKKIGR